MAIRKITFPQQVSGDRWTTEKVNEIKDVVNSNADRLSEVSNEVGAATAELRRTVSKGIFLYGTNLTTAVDSPRIGDWCVVLGSGNVFPGTVYTYNGTTWTAGGSWSPNGTVDLADYPTKAEMEASIEEHAIETADNLTTETTGKALDAHQGFVLAGQIGELNGTAKELTRWGWYNEGSDILPLYSVTSNRYIKEDGSGLSSSSACQVTEFISVEHIDRLAYRLRRQASMCTIAAYSDKDMGTFIAENSVIKNSSSGSGITEGIWQKQEGTKFIRCTLWARETNYLVNPDAKIEIDTQPTKGSGNPVSSDAVAIALENISNSIDDVRGKVSTFAGEASSAIGSLIFKVNGGEKEISTDGKTLKSATNHYYYLTEEDAITGKSSNSYSRWIIPNNGYKKVRVYTRYNTSTVPAGVACVLLCFAVGSDFVFDETKGYVQAGSFVYYPAHAVSAQQSSGNYYWLTVNDDEYIEIPEGTTSICVTCRCKTTTTTPQIWLYSTEEIKGIEKDVEELKEAVFGGSGGGGDDDDQKTITTNLGTNNDQNCLLLRNHIQTNWPYYFAISENAEGYDTQGYLDKRIADIPEGKHFIFITDGHWQDNPTKNTKTSTYIASYVSKRLGGCPVVFGGDCINSASSKYLAAKAFSDYADIFYSAFGDTGLWVQGNHDSNKLGIDTDNGISVDDAIIDDTEIYKRSVARIAHKVTFDEVGLAAIQNIGLTEEELANAVAWMKLHYHWDDHANKVRYIVYETGCTGWTWYKLCNTRTYSLPLLYPWVSRTMLSTPDDYDIVILGHMFGGKTASYTDYASGNTDSRNIMRLFRAFKLKSSIKLNMRSYHTSGGTAFSRAICGTSENRTFDFTSSKHKGHIFIVSGHWHNDLSFMCRYYTNIDGEEGKNGINVQRYNAADVTDDTVLHINVACDTAASGRNNYYTSRPSAAGQISECLFDVFTITEDDKLEATRIGYGNDRTFLLSGAQQEYDDDDSDDGGEGGEQEEPGEIINS